MNTKEYDTSETNPYLVNAIVKSCYYHKQIPFSVINLGLLIEMVTELSYKIKPYSNELINYLETLKKSPEKVLEK